VPELSEDGCADDSDHGSSVPIVVVEESRECTCAFVWGVFWSGVAVCVEEHGYQGIEALGLVGWRKVLGRC
jgi:hypothetical protein